MPLKFNAGRIGDNFNLQNTSGPFIEIAYKWVGLSYTIMEYKDEFGRSYSANSIVASNVSKPQNVSI